MIPAIKRLLVEKDSELKVSDLSVIKLSNGVSYRNPKVSFMALRDGNPYLFIKTTRFARDGAYIQQVFEGLSRAHEIVKKYPKLSNVPVPFWREEVSGHAVSAETVVDGRPMDRANADQVCQALFWLDGFIAAGQHKQLSVSELEQGLKTAYDEAGIGTEARDGLGGAFKEAVESWGQSSVPVCAAHGDFTHSNILFSEKGIGVIDWDGFGTIDAPLFDLLTLLDRVTPDGQNPYLVHRADIERSLASLRADWRLVGLAGFLYVVMTDWRKRSKGKIDDRQIWDERLLKSVAKHDAWIKRVFHG